jgi:tetratricopeptide (TPR) repeat protein
MPAEQRFWDFLKHTQDRVVVIVPLITLAVGIIASLRDKARPPVLYLAVFTVFVMAYCAWIAFARSAGTQDGAISPSRMKHSRRTVMLTIAGAAIVVSFAWGFIYREHLAYSTLTRAFSDAPQVAVTEDVAWQLLAYSSPSGAEHQTVAGELAALLDGSPYQLVVVARSVVPTIPSDSRVRAVVSGVSEQSGLVLKVAILGDVKRFEKVVEDSQKQLRGIERASLPATRLWDTPSLARLLTPTVPYSVGDTPEHRTSILRLLLRYTVGMALYVDDRPEAAQLFREMVDISALLAGVRSSSLAELYWGTAFYFAQRAESLDLALRAVSAARGFDPANWRIAASHAWLLLAVGKRQEASRVMTELGSVPDDPALPHWLNADIRKASGDQSGAATLYEQAVREEPASEMREKLHFEAAFAYAMADGMDRRTAGGGIVRHFEDALQSSSNPVYHAVQGYGWALLANEPMFETAFSRARTAVEPIAADNQAATRQFVERWYAKSLLKLRQPARARAAIEQFIGDPQRSTDVTLLQDFGETLVAIAGYTGKPSEFIAAESYFARILELDARNAQAAHFRGATIMMRVQNDRELSAEESARLRDAARRSFLQAISLGFERAVTHTALMMLYIADGDDVNAERHFVRFCELGGEDKECLLKRANDLSIAGKAAEAEPLFVEYLRLDPRSFTGHDNLAFVLFELDRPSEALRHWEEALRLEPAEPDALAGKAIALQSMGNRGSAIAAYKAAVVRDAGFLDSEVLRNKYAWSDKARRAAAPLIESLRN